MPIEALNYGVDNHKLCTRNVSWKQLKREYI